MSNDEQRHIISLTIDPSKEIRTIAEREATLKGKRTVIGMSQNLERFWAYFLAIFFGDSLDGDIVGLIWNDFWLVLAIFLGDIGVSLVMIYGAQMRRSLGTKVHDLWDTIASCNRHKEYDLRGRIASFSGTKGA
eukprot:531817_1